MTTPDAPLKIEPIESADDALRSRLSTLMARALPPEERDDRFAAWTGRGAIATAEGQPVGYVGGALDGGRVRLDALIDPHVAGADTDETADLGERLLDAAVTQHGEPAVGAVIEWWGRPAGPWHDRVAVRRAMTPTRALYQMRCSLPVDLEPVPTRSFEPGDLDELVAVNNRAFASHPDQGGLTVDRVRATMAEPWFRAEGLRVYVEGGRMAGFCWTKIHPAPPAATALGEIYVICVDPDFHGRGLGRPMTAAGLSWLSDQGLSTGMLYVEADNEPAVKTYQGLGFSVLRTDRAWEWDPPR